LWILWCPLFSVGQIFVLFFFLRDSITGCGDGSVGDGSIGGSVEGSSTLDHIAIFLQQITQLEYKHLDMCES